MKRLRDLPDMDVTYPEPHDHRIYGHGHHLRVESTIVAAKWVAGVASNEILSAADLSCGNGAVLDAVDVPVKIYGDYAPGYPIQGRIEETIEQIDRVGLFINAETLEHLEDPMAVLHQIRKKARRLVLSTPVSSLYGFDSNPEHLWQWDRVGVEEMLAAANWRTVVYSSVDSRPMTEMYEYGIWVCR